MIEIRLRTLAEGLNEGFAISMAQGWYVSSCFLGNVFFLVTQDFVSQNYVQIQLYVWVSQGWTQSPVVTWSSRDMSLDHISQIVLYKVPFKEIFNSSVVFHCVKWNLFIFNHILPFCDANGKFPDLSMTSALSLELVTFFRTSFSDL